MTIEEFYQACAELLETPHEGTAFSHHRRNRWNNRTPGRGRFAGYGIIRAFGETVHVHLHHPVELIGVYESHHEALLSIENMLTNKSSNFRLS